jgi:prepilin-type N-terminal cleavage/methylation domain-containing protein
MRKRERGFSILEILIVVAILGIIAAIAIWNYFDAIQRSKQKRTMADMRTIAVAWESRAVDSRAYNAAGFTFPPSLIGYSTMDGMLVPTYVKVVSRKDAWGNAWEFATDAAVGSGKPANLYAIRSAGRDGAFASTTYAGGGTTNFDCDIVYSAGGFVQWPEGTQNGQ